MTFFRDIVYRIFSGTQSCKICGNWQVVGNLEICPECLDKFSFIKENYCMECGRYLPEGEGLLCESCQNEHLFEAGRSLFKYQDYLRTLILQLKFGGRRELAVPLGNLMAVMAEGVFREADVIVPVPLSLNRLEERGFNQSLLLSIPLARRWGLPVNSQVLYRKEDVLPQSMLTGTGRKENIRGIFGLRYPDKIIDRKVLLIDDIITTGSTAGEAARVLRRGGAKSVFLLTLASTIQEKHI